MSRLVKFTCDLFFLLFLILFVSFFLSWCDLSVYLLLSSSTSTLPLLC